MGRTSEHRYSIIPSEPQSPLLASERTLDGHSLAQRVAQTRKFSHWTLHPHARVFHIWNPIMLMLIFIDTWLQPFLCAFSFNIENAKIATATRLFGTYVWLMYVMDTMMQCFVQVHKVDGCGMATAPRDVALIYVSSKQFRLDLATIIPWTFFYEKLQPGRIAPGQGAWAVIMMMFGLLRLLRACRLSTAPRLFHIWRHAFHVGHAIRTAAECAFRMLIQLHYMACIWAMVGLVNPQGEETWIDAWRPQATSRIDIIDIYISSFYWSITTTTGVGYGDLTPAAGNIVELSSCILLMAIAGYGWTSMIANAVQLVQDSHAATEKYRKTVDIYEELFKNQAIDPPIRHQIREYFVKFFEFEDTSDLQNVIHDMSPMLQREVVKATFSHWIAQVPWIRKMSDSCLNCIVFKMKEFLYVPREYIPDLRITRFVQQGAFMVGGQILRKGNCWGVDMTLDGPMRRRDTGFALNFASTLGLMRRCLEEVLDDFPEDAWMVKRASCFLALKRKFIELAKEYQKERRRRSGKTQTSAERFLRQVTQGKGWASHSLAHQFTVLSDDSRFLYDHMNAQFQGLRDKQDTLENNQSRILSRLSQIEEHLLNFELVD